MRNTGLEEAQAGIKIAGRNVNNLRYADDTTLMAKSKELKSLLMKVKEDVNETNLNSHLFTFRVQSRGSFIQKQDVRLSNKGASYGNALFLATRELSSFVPYSGVVFL